MRTALSSTPLLLLLAACASPPAATSPPRTMLRGADCLDPQTARSWKSIDDDVVLVDSGRRKYRITVNGRCLWGSDVTLRFAGDPISGRVCGNGTDRLLTRDGECWIERMELIDAQEWQDTENAPEAEIRSESTQ